jgi:hypothetical protein
MIQPYVLGKEPYDVSHGSMRRLTRMHSGALINDPAFNYQVLIESLRNQTALDDLVSEANTRVFNREAHS